MDSEPRVRVPGSVRAPIPGAEVVGPVDPGERAEVTVVLRRHAPLPTGERMGRDELADRYGADPADVELARSAVEAAGAEVVRVDPASRRMRVAGPVGTLAELFATELQQARVPDGQLVRQRTGALSVPAGLADAVVAVLGLDDRPQGRSRVVRAAAVERSYTPPELAEVYAIPADTDGAGTSRDHRARRRVRRRPTCAPTSPASACPSRGDGGRRRRRRNQPGSDPDGADGEVMLDIEVAGALAPGAPTSWSTSRPTPTRASSTRSARPRTPTRRRRRSASAGARARTSGPRRPVRRWTTRSPTPAALGVTVTAAAGDDGTADATTDGGARRLPGVQPARARLRRHHAVGRADQRDRVGRQRRHRRRRERTFPLPACQSAAGVPRPAAGRPGRGVPDVAADADPQTGYQIRVDGKEVVIGGTSAVSPLWAALVGRLDQALGEPLGRLHEALYDAAGPGVAPPGFRDVTVGANGAYDAGPGWDPCTGLGIPDGTALLAALRSG